MNANEIKANTFDIVGGPNKDTLFDACKYAGDKRARINIYFSVRIGHTGLPNAFGSAYVLMDISDVVIRGIIHLDETSDRFELYGTCRIKIDDYPREGEFRFIARYEPKIRRGDIRFYGL